MRVLHFILGKANKDRANGVNQVVCGLAKYCARNGAEVRVIGIAEFVNREGEIIDRDGFGVEAYSRWGFLFLYRALTSAIEWTDIVHLHGVFAPWNLWVAGLCRMQGKPYVVTLHDGLAPERAAVRGRFKKKVFHALLQRGHLQCASGVHVIAEEEATDLFAVARPRKVFCIPNGIDLEDYSGLDRRIRGTSDDINIGYLGRLSAEKNLEALCMAFAKVNVNGNLRLKLAGPLTKYGHGLSKRFSSYGVELVGPVYGHDKDHFISQLDLFVIPSLAEVFSIAAAESLALGTPLLITRTSKVSHYFNQNAFFMCEPTVFGLERGLRQAIDRRVEWAIIVINGRHLVENRLNWEAVARDMLREYARIARKHI
ncbi:MAG: hypothetical protein VR64_22875 [Desulfatitalea sp. BRH_c12]|nr:MAG: hypothetical protein VR64_22875 [Desulfatitalea sp. BRH_c12]